MKPISHNLRLAAMTVAVFLGLMSGTTAQNRAAVSGLVQSLSTGKPVCCAEVFLKPVNKGTLTDEAGKYAFKNLPEGTYTLTVQCLGFESYNEIIELKTGEILTHDVSVRPDVQYLQGVEVTEMAVQKESYIKDIIGQEQIGKLAARDIGDFLRSEPNVSGIRKGGGNVDPVIRGLKFGQLNVQVNTGHKIEGGCPNRMDPAASHIDVNDISRIEILKGPYALRYGTNFGAVLNLITEKARPFKKWNIEARAIKGWESNWNGNKEHITILGGNEHIFFAVSGNNYDFGNYEDGNGNEIKSSFRKYNFSAEAGFVPWKNHELRLTYKNSQGRDFNFPSLPMDERADNTQLYSASYHYRNEETFLQTLDAKIYLSDVNHEMDNKWRPFSDTMVAISTIDALNRGGRMDFGFKTGKSGLHLGMDYEDIKKDGQRVKHLIAQPNLPVKTEDLWSNASIRNLGVFAEYRIKQNIFLEWIFAVRLDMNSATSDPMKLLNMAGAEVYRNDTTTSDFTNMSLSAGLSYEITSELTLDIALGRGVRNPDMVERFIILLPVGYDNYDYLGNPELNPENNHQADLTLKYVCDRSGSFRMNGFYSIITNYITGIKLPPSQVMAQSKGVLGVKEFQNIKKANMYGFEFLWTSPARFDWKVKLSAAYTTGYNPEAIKYIYEHGEATGKQTVKNDPLPEIPPFEANLRISYKLLEGRLVPQIHLRSVADQPRISEAYDERHTPGFVIGGLNVNYRINNILTLSGGINNIFDRAYYEHLNRRITGTNASLYEPGRSFYLNAILNI